MTDGARKHVKGIDPGYLSSLTADDPRPFDHKLVINIDGRQITLFNPDKTWTKPNFWSESPTTWTNIHFSDIHNKRVIFTHCTTKSQGVKVLRTKPGLNQV
ncbi:hypothetical protein NL108_015002 [Boleophthalmus pectinirostris]|nr:hypothetical protein NL108_015002 [Boleophthalmus pectinirostris]